MDPPGPNAPLSDGCGNSTQPTASALAALRAWTAAGVPAEKLVLGVPSYGYISRTGARRLRTRGSDPLEDGGDSNDGGDSGDDGAWASAFFQQDAAQTRMGVEGVTVVRNSDGGTDGGMTKTARPLSLSGSLRRLPSQMHRDNPSMQDPHQRR